MKATRTRILHQNVCQLQVHCLKNNLEVIQFLPRLIKVLQIRSYSREDFWVTSFGHKRAVQYTSNHRTCVFETQLYNHLFFLCQTSALVDCDFSYNEEDIESLELKWYFRHDPTPIYTWVPPNDPQVRFLWMLIFFINIQPLSKQVHPSFTNLINPHYEISADPYLKHRALNLQQLSTSLSGRYSCRVSSIYDDEFQSRNLIIFGKLN